jgi:hypothetical protein
VVNRAGLWVEIEVSAGAMKLCSVAGVCKTTLNAVSHHARAGFTDKVATGLVRSRCARCSIQREISMAIAWAMLALLWLALISVIVWVIATAVARSR